MRIAPCCVDGLELAAGSPLALTSADTPQARAADGWPCRWISCRAGDLRPGCKALARPPVRDTPQARAADGRPCGWISCRAGDLRPGCRALARPPLRDTPQGGAADGRPCRWTSWRAGRSAAWLQALARPPSRDTPQVRPCRLWRGIHAAQGPATVGGQGPVKRVDVRGCERDMTCVGRIRGHPISFQAHAEQQPDFSRATQDFPAS
ncbi:hypothetical protein GGR60_003041 [Xanthomonas arboricola]|nr:hypothetical protein [Xanthomonas euroxanthea]